MDGRLARLQGSVDQELLAWLQSPSLFSAARAAPVCRTGTIWCDEFLDQILERANGTDLKNEADVSALMATLAAFSVWGMVDAYRRFIAPVTTGGKM